MATASSLILEDRSNGQSLPRKGSGVEFPGLQLRTLALLHSHLQWPPPHPQGALPGDPVTPLPLPAKLQKGLPESEVMPTCNPYEVRNLLNSSNLEMITPAFAIKLSFLSDVSSTQLKT